MLLARRVVLVAVTAVLAGVGLTGCRADPTVAAYIGSTEKITEADVDAMIDDATTAVGRPEEQGTHVPTRGDVVTTLVLDQVCAQAMTSLKFQASQVSTEQIKQAEGTPSTAKYTERRAKMWGCLSGVPQANEPPSEAELREIYDLALAAGALNGSFEEVKPQLEGDQTVLQATSIDRVMTKAAKAADVSVSPRYRPLEFPVFSLQNGTSIVSIPMGELGSDAVRDLT